MITLLSPKTYNGHFTTISWIPDRGWQSTYWGWGHPFQHIVYQTFFEALLEELQSGLTLANEAIRQMFEEDVRTGADA